MLIYVLSYLSRVHFSLPVYVIDVSCHINEMTRYDAVICLQDTAMVAVWGGGGEENNF
jgi:hypothetical protein